MGHKLRRPHEENRRAIRSLIEMIGGDDQGGLDVVVERTVLHIESLRNEIEVLDRKRSWARADAMTFKEAWEEARAVAEERASVARMEYDDLMAERNILYDTAEEAEALSRQNDLLETENEMMRSKLKRISDVINVEHNYFSR